MSKPNLQQPFEPWLDFSDDVRFFSLDDLAKSADVHGLTVDELKSVFRGAIIEPLKRPPKGETKWTKARIRIGTIPREGSEVFETLWGYLQHTVAPNMITICKLFTQSSAPKAPMVEAQLNWDRLVPNEWVRLLYASTSDTASSTKTLRVKFMMKVALLLTGHFDGKVTLDESKLGKAKQVWVHTFAAIKENLKVRPSAKTPLPSKDEAPVRSLINTSASQFRSTPAPSSSSVSHGGRKRPNPAGATQVPDDGENAAAKRPRLDTHSTTNPSKSHRVSIL